MTSLTPGALCVVLLGLTVTMLRLYVLFVLPGVALYWLLSRVLSAAAAPVWVRVALTASRSVSPNRAYNDGMCLICVEFDKNRMSFRGSAPRHRRDARKSGRSPQQRSGSQARRSRARIGETDPNMTPPSVTP